MNTKHTPGPWCLDPLQLGTVGDICTLDGTPIAQAQMRQPMAAGKPDDERQANARLIAAAPDLLDALRDMVSDRNQLSEATVSFAKAAIAKATGEEEA